MVTSCRKQINVRRRLIPNIINLQAFECASRHCNFSRAGEELNLSQSSVSRQVAELEQQMGVQLFSRVRQRIVLSDAGRRLLPEARELLVHAERFMIGAVANGSLTGSLRVATLPTFGVKWLVPRLGSFLSDHPEVAITVESRSQVFSFEDDNFDIAIHFGRDAWAGGIATFLCNEKILPVASPALATLFKVENSIPSNVPLLHLLSRPKLWSDWSDLHDIDIADPYKGQRFDQFSMLTVAATAGLGAALLPTYLIEPELQNDTLVPLVDLPIETENAYYLVRPEHKQGNELTDKFQSWLLSEMDIE